MIGGGIPRMNQEVHTLSILAVIASVLCEAIPTVIHATASLAVTDKS
jgi:hypothetical protein